MNIKKLNSLCDTLERVTYVEVQTLILTSIGELLPYTDKDVTNDTFMEKYILMSYLITNIRNNDLQTARVYYDRLIYFHFNPNPTLGQQISNFWRYIKGLIW